MFTPKDRFHFDILKNNFLGETNTPFLDKIAIYQDFDINEFNTFISRLNYYDGIQFRFSDFENSMKNEFGIDRPMVKSIIIGLYHSGSYQNIVAQYLKSNMDAFDSVSYELQGIYDALHSMGRI